MEDSEERRTQNARLYRQFTRRKFNKYKHQFPRMRESELIHKIIREWEALSPEQKLRVKQNFIESSGDRFLKPSTSKSKSKSRSGSPKSLAKKMNKPIKKEKKKISPKVRIFVDKKAKNDQDSQSSNFRHDQREKKPNYSASESSSEIGIEIQKKPIRQKNNESYLNFYKFYYNRLGSEHPRWSSSQITTIIRLLWRKRKITTLRKQGRIDKIMSGRMKYRKEKLAEGFLQEDIKVNWKRLPHESKMHWIILGKGPRPKIPLSSHRKLRKVLKSGRSFDSEHKKVRNLNWMSE